MISVDETNGVVDVPAQYRKIVHTVDTFAEMGLPLFPSREKLLWHSGDYPLYQLQDEIDTDFIFMMEGDSSAAGPIDDLFQTLADDGVGYCPRNFRPMEPGNALEVTKRYFDKVAPDTQLFTGSFASFWIDRTAIKPMLAERRRMAEVVTDPDDWVYCEALAATVAHAAGFKCGKLWDYADMRRHKWLNPVRPEEVVPGEDGRVRFYHPVLDSPKWEQKRLEHLESEDKRLRREVKRMRKELDAKKKQFDRYHSKANAFYSGPLHRRLYRAVFRRCP